MDANGLGRGVITLIGSPQSSPIYLVSRGKGFIINTLGGESSGTFDLQTAGPFNNSSVTGSYALGTFPTLANGQTSSGVITITAPGTLTETTDSPNSLPQNVTGSYSVSANGRATLTITPSAGTQSHDVFYLISPSKAVSIEIDAGTTNTSITVVEK